MRVPDPLLHDEIVRNAAWLRRLASSLARGHDPDDLAQEVCLALLKAPPPEGMPARPWLAGVARNLARMQRRGDGRRLRRESDAAAGAEHEAAETDALFEHLEAQRHVERLLLELDEPFRGTVRLRYEDDLTAAEIARREGVPAGTVRWRLKEGLDRLRVALERHEGREGARRCLLLLLFGPALGPHALPEGAGSLTPTSRTDHADASARGQASGAQRGGGLPWTLVAGLALPALLGLVGLSLARRSPPSASPERARLEAAPAPPKAALTRRGAGQAKPASEVTTMARVVEDPSALAGVIAGSILDSNSGRGIVGARLVFARGEESLEMTSGEAGEFSFAAETPGPYALVSARADGYFAFAPELGQSPVVAVARPGRRVEKLAVHLGPAQAFRGVVVGPSGEPIAGAEVRLLEAQSRERALDPLPERFVTDREGAFWFHAPDGAALDVFSADYGSTRTWVGQNTLISRELVIRLSRGDIRPTPRAKPLAGRVIDESGTPVAGALVRSEPEASDGAMTAQTLTDIAGRFSFSTLALGTHRLFVSRTGGGVPHAFSGQRAGETDLRLVLRRGGSVEGRVVRAMSGEPVPSFTLFLTEPVGLARRTLDVRAVVDAEGRFRFDDVPEGAYRLVALSLGLAASTEWPLRVRAGEASSPVELTLADGGQVRGRVVAAEDGRPIERAWVWVYRPSLSGHDVLPPNVMALTDADGAFTLRGLEPGLRSISIGAAGRHGRLLSGLVIEDGAEAEPALVALPKAAPGEGQGIDLGGLGALYKASEDAMTIVGTWPGGGAAEAGLVPGDEIVAIDGVSVVELGADAFLERTRAPEQGVPARLLVRRANERAPVELTVPRRVTRR